MDLIGKRPQCAHTPLCPRGSSAGPRAILERVNCRKSRKGPRNREAHFPCCGGQLIGPDARACARHGLLLRVAGLNVTAIGYVQCALNIGEVRLDAFLLGVSENVLVAD